MRTVDPAKLFRPQKIALLTHPEGRGFTFDEMVARMFPEYPECGHDHVDTVAAGLATSLALGTLISYAHEGVTYYCLTMLGLMERQVWHERN